MLAVFAVLAATLTTARPAAASEDPYVITAGQEELLTAMLGGTDALPGGCRLAGATVDRSRVTARYGCAAARTASIELRHPDAPGARPSTATKHFALVTGEPSPAPPALLDAVAGRIREREASFQWSLPAWAERPDAGGAPPEPPPAVRQPPQAREAPFERYLGWALVPLLPWLLRRPSDGARVFALRAAGCVAFGLAAFSVVHGGLRCAGGAVVGVVFRRAWDTAGALGLAVLSATAMGAMAWLWRDRALRAAHALAASAVFCCAAATSYGDDVGLVLDEPMPFGAVVALPPLTEQTDQSPNRPTIRFRTNSRGFRGPNFADRPAAGMSRVVLIGDSFVFGSGIAWEETLGEALRAALAERAAGRAFETVNLGIPGDNLPSHVAVYEQAAATLHPDYAVLCLTLPNDLSTYDDQPVRKAESRTSRFRLVQWAFGASLARLAWSAGKLSDAFTPEAFAVLDRETARLSAMRAAPGAPPLFVYSYFGGPARVRATFESLPGVRVVQNPPADSSYSFPNDSHPTAAGNRAFAASIADAIVGSPASPQAASPPP